MNVLKRAIAMVLALGIGMTSVNIQSAWAEDEAPAALVKDLSDAQAQWREDLKKAKDARAGMYTVGAVTGVAGVALMVVGNVKAASAGDVDGCTRDGLFNVTCFDQQSYNEAQSRLDDGRKLFVVGLISGLVGAGFIVGGSRKNEKVDELERVGRREGYTLSVAPTERGGVQMTLSKAF